MFHFFKAASDRIPAQYLDEWHLNVFLNFKKRLHIMGVTAIVGYALLHVLHYFFVGGMAISTKLALVASFTGLNLLLILVNTRTRKIAEAKAVGFVVTVAILLFFVHAEFQSKSMGLPYTFTTTTVIVLFFMSLMLTWNVGDVLVLALTNTAALVFYHMFELHAHGEDIFLVVGQRLFLNGCLNLFLATLFCMIVKYYDNRQSAHNFILLKEVESQKNKVQTLNAQLLSELKLASKIHETLIPRKYEDERLAVSVVYKPISEVGGDYANFVFLDDGNLLFLMSDVTGHGVPAALVVSRFENEFQRLAKQTKSPGEVLSRLNRFVMEHLGGTGMYMTAFCGLINFAENKLIYSSYGHPDQYLIHGPDRRVQGLSSLTTMVGVLEDDTVYENTAVIEKGDQIVLFTDGVIEVKNSTGEQFGTERAVDVLREGCHVNADACADVLLYESIKHYQEGAFQDDVFILSIKYKK